MPAIETTDWLALRARIDTLVTDPVMRVLDPGEVFTPPNDSFQPEPYILLSDITNEPLRFGIAPRAGRVDHVRSGVLMLTVHWPIARDITHAQLKEIAGQIAGHFAADTCMSFGPSRLRVTQDADMVQPYVDGAYRVAVVRVVWSSM